MAEINFTESGKKHTKGNKKKWTAIFNKMAWNVFKEGERVALMPGMAIKQIIKETPARPLRWAISHSAAPYGLVGVEFRYKDAIVKSYWIDEGDTCTCLASAPEYVTKMEAVI
jgi:hypothetical protein